MQWKAFKTKSYIFIFFKSSSLDKRYPCHSLLVIGALVSDTLVVSGPFSTKPKTLLNFKQNPLGALSAMLLNWS